MDGNIAFKTPQSTCRQKAIHAESDLLSFSKCEQIRLELKLTLVWHAENCFKYYYVFFFEMILGLHTFYPDALHWKNGLQFACKTLYFWYITHAEERQTTVNTTHKFSTRDWTSLFHCEKKRTNEPTFYSVAMRQNLFLRNIWMPCFDSSHGNYKVNVWCSIDKKSHDEMKEIRIKVLWICLTCRRLSPSIFFFVRQ